MTDNEASHTIKNLGEVEDSAAKFGLSDFGEARFAREDLGAEDTGISRHILNANKRQPFGHKHAECEEIYVVINGSGKIAIGDHVHDISILDAIRVAPETPRAFEAGPDGLEVLAFGSHVKDDGEILQGWWPTEVE